MDRGHTTPWRLGVVALTTAIALLVIVPLGAGSCSYCQSPGELALWGGLSLLLFWVPMAGIPAGMMAAILRRARAASLVAGGSALVGSLILQLVLFGAAEGPGEQLVLAAFGTIPFLIVYALSAIATMAVRRVAAGLAAGVGRIGPEA